MAARCIAIVAILCVFNSIAIGNGETSTKCECAAFANSGEKIETGVEPLIVQNPMNVTCTVEDAKNCEQLCIQLVKVGKERAPEILCEHLGHMKFKPSLWSRTCDSEWKYSGLTCEKTICCHEGKPVDCEE